MEFDEQGRIILPGVMKEDQEKEKRSIILEKYQVNVKSPAIAQLKIKLGSELNVNKEHLIGQIHSFCENYLKNSFVKVDAEVELRGE